MKISIIDLDLCNVNSISKCVEYTGFNCEIAKFPIDIEKSDKNISWDWFLPSYNEKTK